MSTQTSHCHPLPTVFDTNRPGALVTPKFTPVSRPRLTLVSTPEEATTGSCELTVLGEFRLTMDGEPLVPVPSVQRLLAALVCLGRQAPRNKVAQILWPDTSNQRAQANLRTTLYRMQHQSPGLVHATTTHIGLVPMVRVDLERIRSAALSLLDDPERHLDVLRLVPWPELGKDLLPDWDEEWLADHQFSHRKLRLDALEQLAHRYIHRGQYGAAVQSALIVIQAEPLRESAHEALIHAYLGQGNRAEAIAHYTGYRKSLRDELGLEPARTLDKLLWEEAS